eukprot:NODE_10589_length_1341_cov_8.222405.p1 GENE.NODE_10589_length_1341_cov_8.222405~~NODE_10589_length_1341_cov_8.222405.p1  ORF type:complete len:319 (-),score=100.81 NODE_10589_length_1341_cov_8.222405:179-1135(-)
MSALAAQADACVLLKHLARLSGDFVQQRFARDCWPGLWTRLKTTHVVCDGRKSRREEQEKQEKQRQQQQQQQQGPYEQQEEYEDREQEQEQVQEWVWEQEQARDQNTAADEEETRVAWSPELKAQVAALDVLTFLASDAALIRGFEEQLLMLAIKFSRACAARALKKIASALLRRLAAAEPNLFWLYARSLLLQMQTCKGGAGPAGTREQQLAAVQITSPAGLEQREHKKRGEVTHCLEHWDELGKEQGEEHVDQPWCPKLPMLAEVEDFGLDAYDAAEPDLLQLLETSAPAVESLPRPRVALAPWSDPWSVILSSNG